MFAVEYTKFYIYFTYSHSQLILIQILVYNLSLNLMPRIPLVVVYLFVHYGTRRITLKCLIAAQGYAIYN